MKKRFWEGALMAAAALGLILTAVLIAAFIQHPPTGSGDWATWLGAIGTILAFGGTIWLATSQERQRRQKERDIAHLVAARIAGELDILIDRTSSVSGVLAFSDDIWGAWHHLPDVSFPDQNSALCSVDFLSLLTPLPNRASHRIAKAIGLLQAVTADIVQTKNSHALREYSERQQKAFLEEWCALVSEAHELLQVARDQCRGAADMGAPHPSVEEIHGPLSDEDFRDD